MERPSDLDIQAMLEWVCPGRQPDIKWSTPARPLEDDIKYELRLLFVDDDLTLDSFRAIIRNYISYQIPERMCKERSEGRVVFSLTNLHCSMYATVVRGQLECVDHDNLGNTSSAAISMNAAITPMDDARSATFHGSEYFIGGRRHRSNNLPAVDNRIYHSTVDTQHIETNTEVQYWEHGHPIYGPRPWQLTTDATIMNGDSGKLVTIVRNLEVKWMIEYKNETVPSYPLKLRISRVMTTTVPPKEKSRVEVEWMPELSTPNKILSREIEGLQLYWLVRPGKVAVLDETVVFEQLGINPINVDWGGDRFFIRENDAFAFECYLMSDNVSWQTNGL